MNGLNRATDLHPHPTGHLLGAFPSLTHRSPGVQRHGTPRSLTHVYEFGSRDVRKAWRGLCSGRGGGALSSYPRFAAACEVAAVRERSAVHPLHLLGVAPAAQRWSPPPLVGWSRVLPSHCRWRRRAHVCFISGGDRRLSPRSLRPGGAPIRCRGSERGTPPIMRSFGGNKRPITLETKAGR